MSLEITGIRDLSLEEWDCVSGGTGTSSPPPPNNINLTTQELTSLTIGTTPCDFTGPNGLAQNACWTITDNASGDTVIEPANTTLSYDGGDGTFAGGGYNDPAIFQY